MRNWIFIGVVTALCFSTVASAAPSANLTTDFSTTNNPTQGSGGFGNWSYNYGSTPLPT